ncbi:MAG TPA: YbhB/YbcL family Raf kinase inhibitor-like protein [Nevskiaceae bacterium]|nr:YbhB/YbcL family Raf kinase inhibitor-like protein [Nevskiaceae bacterium]
MLKKFIAAAALCASGAALAAGPAFTLGSTDVAANQKMADKQVFNGFGCTGGNVSPALAWKNAPAATKSFALTVYDPDAPTGSGWWHWVVYNIPADTTALPADAGSGKGLPAGAVQGRTDFGSAGWGGPCPPAGDKPHHYIFTLHALKTDKLDVPADASAAMVGFMIHANEIGKAKFTALYNR